MTSNGDDNVYPPPSDEDYENADRGFIRSMDPCVVHSSIPGKEKVEVWNNVCPCVMRNHPCRERKKVKVCTLASFKIDY